MVCALNSCLLLIGASVSNPRQSNILCGAHVPQVNLWSPAFPQTVNSQAAIHSFGILHPTPVSRLVRASRPPSTWNPSHPSYWINFFLFTLHPERFATASMNHPLPWVLPSYLGYQAPVSHGTGAPAYRRIAQVAPSASHLTSRTQQNCVGD